MLIDQVKDVFMVFNDRAYMKVDRAMLKRVEDLARDPKKPFFREGKPAAKIHGRLLDSIQEKQGFSELLSFRGEGGPSLQMVIAVPPVDSPHTYAEFDLDFSAICSRTCSASWCTWASCWAASRPTISSCGRRWRNPKRADSSTTR